VAYLPLHRRGCPARRSPIAGRYTASVPWTATIPQWPLATLLLAVREPASHSGDPLRRLASRRAADPSGIWSCSPVRPGPAFRSADCRWIDESRAVKQPRTLRCQAHESIHEGSKAANPICHRIAGHCENAGEPIHRSPGNFAAPRRPDRPSRAWRIALFSCIEHVTHPAEHFRRESYVSQSYSPDAQIVAPKTAVWRHTSTCVKRSRFENPAA
jgi:hypothetical protein